MKKINNLNKGIKGLWKSPSFLLKNKKTGLVIIEFRNSPNWYFLQFQYLYCKKY